MIRVLKPGLLTTVQDRGRRGFAHLGVSPAGAADSLSFRMANLLVGNPENAPAVEITLLGPVLEFEKDALVAITGSTTSTALPLGESFTVKAGDRLEFGSLTSGARAYLAVRGGIDVPLVMNSASTFLAASIGGHHGRAFRAGDELSVGHLTSGKPRRMRTGVVKPADGPIRVVPGPQHPWFDAANQDVFSDSAFIVTDQSNRAGLRLSGPMVRPQDQRELITEGVALGAVQIPPDGQPIILFVDQQTTGGYPKIANVISADLPRVGQLRPRDPVRFQFVSLSEAIDLLRRQEEALREAFA